MVTWQVTPNPRDLLAEQENMTEQNTWTSTGSLLKRAASASGEQAEAEYSSVPVCYSFPPPQDPFDPWDTSLVVGSAGWSEGEYVEGVAPRSSRGGHDGADVVLDLGGGLWYEFTVEVICIFCR